MRRPGLSAQLVAWGPPWDGDAGPVTWIERPACKTSVSVSASIDSPTRGDSVARLGKATLIEGYGRRMRVRIPPESRKGALGSARIGGGGFPGEAAHAVKLRKPASRGWYPAPIAIPRVRTARPRGIGNGAARYRASGIILEAGKPALLQPSGAVPTIVGLSNL